MKIVLGRLRFTLGVSIVGFNGNARTVSDYLTAKQSEQDACEALHFFCFRSENYNCRNDLQ